MKELRNDLEQVLQQKQILFKEPLARHTTFRVGGPAELLLTPSAKQLPEVMRILNKHRCPVTVIGNGSNLLVGDKGIRGAVIEIGSCMSDISVDGACITAQAGAMLARVAMQAYQSGLSGMEFAAGIPGSVGGAMVMNAGAYGGEMKDIVVSVDVLDQDGRVVRLAGEEMDFSYRHSCITEQGYLALSAVFHLQKAEPQAIWDRMEELKERRVSKQPLEYPSAGSTFKRPEGFFAGKLIMDAGLAGFTIGGAQVSPKHCGFVINRGGASPSDVLAVIRHVQKTVKEQFGVDLEPEVKLLGEFAADVQTGE